MKVDKDDIETNPTFTSKDANKLNRIDMKYFIPDTVPAAAATPAAIPAVRAVSRPAVNRPPVSTQLITPPVEKPTTPPPLPEKRVRKPNSRFKDYVMLGGKLVPFL